MAELSGAEPRPAESIRIVVNPQPLSNVEQEINIYHSKLQVKWELSVTEVKTD